MTQNSDTFWIGGKHTVLEALKNPKRIVVEVILSNNLINDEEIKKFTKIKKTFKDNAYINKIFKGEITHQGYAAKIKKIDQGKMKNSISSENIESFIVLDGIHDPRNIGAIVRSAVAFDFKNIIVNKNQTNTKSYLLYKAASGAMEHINFFETSNIYNEIKLLKKNDFFVYGLSSKGNKELYSFKFPKKYAVVLGSEERGIKNYIELNCDDTIKIPISQNIESLNVSIAAATLFSFIQCQKKSPL